VARLQDAVVLEVQASLRLFGGAPALLRRLMGEAGALGVQRIGIALIAWVARRLGAARPSVFDVSVRTAGDKFQPIKTTCHLGRAMKHLVLLSLLLVTGCQTMQGTASAPQPRPVNPSAACYGTFDTNPRFAVLLPHLGSLSRYDRATVEMMASKDLPTPEEKEALRQWGFARQLCAQSGEKFMAAAPQWAQNVVANGNAGLLLAIAKLYGGDINYGQFIAERARLNQEARASAEAAQRQDAQQNTAAQRLVEERRRNVQAETDRALLMLQPTQPVPRASINCTSQQLGNTIQTNCN